MLPDQRDLHIGVRLRARLWPGAGRTPFLLLHGLASNACTWDRVADQLHAAGHPVAALDQRGHGRSDKPETGYDLATAAVDAAGALAALGWSGAILVGQSWGGTVVLEAAARDPGLVRGVGCVDGGFINLRAFPDATWERISRDLRPPDLAGTPRERLAAMIRTAHPQWNEAGVEATLENFEVLDDGTVRPRLHLSRHMALLRALWEVDTAPLFARVTAPVLLCVAGDGKPPDAARRAQVAAAARGLRHCAVRPFPGADHDIHVHRPAQLAHVFLEELTGGVWSGAP